MEHAILSLFLNVFLKRGFFSFIDGEDPIKTFKENVSQ
jgi:hypothetical protein